MYIYQKIVDYLTHLIKKNIDSEEYVLPSENQLCAKFKASRVSVRKAFEELKKKDLIHSQKGKGYYINTKKPPDLDSNLHHKLLFSFISTNVDLRHKLNLLNGINHFCNQNNICCSTMLSYNDPLLELNKLHEAINLQSDGIILFPSDCDMYSMEFLKLLNYNVPIILIDRYLQGLNIPYVSSNHFEMSYNAVKWFYQKNIIDIVCISHQKNISSSLQDRYKGIQKGLLDFMGSINKHNFINDEVPLNELYNYYYSYFKKHPNIKGIIYHTSDTMPYLFKALKDLNKKINEDIFIIFFDNESSIPSEYASIHIPTIIQDGFSIGYTAASNLLEMVHNHSFKPDNQFIPVQYQNWND